MEEKRKRKKYNCREEKKEKRVGKGALLCLEGEGGGEEKKVEGKEGMNTNNGVGGRRGGTGSRAE